MHSGDKLIGKICKCMECSSKRAARLDHEVRMRYRDEYNGVQLLMDQATDAQLKAESERALAVRQQRALRARVLEEIINEDKEDKRELIEEAMER